MRKKRLLGTVVTLASVCMLIFGCTSSRTDTENNSADDSNETAFIQSEYDIEYTVQVAETYRVSEVRVEDSYGGRTTVKWEKHEYDSNGNLISKDEYATDKKTLITRTTYEYDSNNNVLKETEKGKLDDWDDNLYDLNWINYEYDSNGNMLSEEHVFSDDYKNYYGVPWDIYYKIAYEYDSEGHMIKESHLDKDGKCEETYSDYSYDANGFLSEETIYSYEDYNYEDSEGAKWEVASRIVYTYDSDGNLIRQDRIENFPFTWGLEEFYDNTTEYEYNASGLLVKETKFEYDEEYDDENDDYLRDENGKIVQSRSENWEENKYYEYDELNNLVKETQTGYETIIKDYYYVTEDGVQLNIPEEEDILEVKVDWNYSIKAFKMYSDNEVDEEINFFFDDKDRMVEFQEIDYKGLLNHKETFMYDSEGNFESIVEVFVSDGLVSSYELIPKAIEYDNNTNLTYYEIWDEWERLQGSFNYKYDGNGNLSFDKMLSGETYTKTYEIKYENGFIKNYTADTFYGEDNWLNSTRKKDVENTIENDRCVSQKEDIYVWEFEYDDNTPSYVKGVNILTTNPYCKIIK